MLVYICRTEGEDELMHLGEVVEARPEKQKEGTYLLVQLGGETQRAEVCGSRYQLYYSVYYSVYLLC